MTKESRHQKILWLEHLLWVLGLWAALAVALGGIALWSGLANPLLRRALVGRMEKLTGAQVEIRTVSVAWFSLNATINGLVVHGKEPPGTEPLFSVEQAKMGLRIDSFWGRKVSVNELTLESPRVHILVAKDGSNNLPTIPRKSASQTPLQQQLLELRASRVEIKNGWFLYNNLRKLVAIEGGEFHARVDQIGRAHV